MGADNTPADDLKTSKTGIMRVLDAAANRAVEGLRVAEDYVRFVLDDRHLTDEWKRLRHDLASVLSRLSSNRRCAARDTQNDVGTKLTLPTERTRGDFVEVVEANIARLKQSLRCLEEYAKLLDADLAGEFETLRYRTYTLERVLNAVRQGCKRLNRVRLMVLIDGGRDQNEFECLVESLVAAGAGAIQLRDKSLGDRELLDRAKIVRALALKGDSLVVVNDRPDLAALADADGVHIGQDDLSVKDTRKIVGPDMLIGVSTHSIQQARQAVMDGANYLGVGPTFASQTKHFNEFPGHPLLCEVAAQITLPCFAIGGISPENVPKVLAAGLSRVAVSGAITAAADPAEATRLLLDILPELE